MKDDTQYSVLTEQGDLGLGVSPLSEEDNETYKDYLKKKKEKFFMRNFVKLYLKEQKFMFLQVMVVGHM